DAGIETAANEEVFRIAARERVECLLDERLGNIRGAVCRVVEPYRVRERAANELVDAVADPRVRIRLAGRSEAEGCERVSEAVGEVRYRVDEGAVEIEGDDRCHAGVPAARSARRRLQA